MAANPYVQQARDESGIDQTIPFNDLTWDEQQRYRIRLAQLIVLHASEFDAQTVAYAQKVLGVVGTLPAPETYGVTDALSDFGAGVVEQEEKLNPLSEQNRGKFASWLMLLGIVGVAVFAFVKGGGFRSTSEKGK